ncbi:MAG: pantetheine-phosphate adenylyltransferase [Pelagibacteraceae bacterium]|nr:pantetheine-phosphate adenylyltransferase [Pelagibacteraceae bacterium]
MEKIGVYPGSFDPIHKGHIDVVNRALRFVDKLYIAVADSPHKNPLFTLNERKDMIDNEFSNSSSIEVVAFDNLLVEFAKSLNAKVIVIGLRVVSDFEYEFQMVGMNRQLNSEIETVFLMADAQRQSISSNFIRDIARLDGDISNFTTDYVSSKLKEKFNN